MLRVSEIKKAKTNATLAKIRQNIKSLKVGEYFEVTGVNTEKEKGNLPRNVAYYATRENVRLKTRMKSNSMRIERIPAK